MELESGLRSRPRLAVLMAVLSACLTVQTPPQQALAQAPAAAPSATPRSEYETRAELEEQARIAENEHRTSEAWLLRTRLQKGDFQEGDRIVVAMHSLAAPVGPETLIVRAGRVVQLPKMDDLPLDGVLRSELNDRVVHHMARYFIDPEARTIPLIRIGIFGAVGRQGYYYVSADLVLNDVIMRAGGPGGDADLDNITIRRGAEVIWDAQSVRAALTDGLSVDRLHLRAGDELMVPIKHHVPWLNIITTTVGLVGMAFSIYQFTRR